MKQSTQSTALSACFGHDGSTGRVIMAGGAYEREREGRREAIDHYRQPRKPSVDTDIVDRPGHLQVINELPYKSRFSK